MRSFIFSCLMMCLCALNAQNSPNFYAKASVQETLAGAPFELTIQYENGQGGQFIAPDWQGAGFSVVGTSQSSSMSIQNGVTNAVVRYQYTLVALESGTHTIPPATMKLGKTEYHTEPITIQVGENPNPMLEPERPRTAPKTQEPSERQEKLKKTLKTTRI